MLLKPREHAKTKSAACLSKKGTPSSSSSLGALFSLQGRRTKPRTMDRGGGSNHRHILFFIAGGGPTPSPSTILPPSRLQGYKPPSPPDPHPPYYIAGSKGKRVFFCHTTPPWTSWDGVEGPKNEEHASQTNPTLGTGGKGEQAKNGGGKKIGGKKKPREERGRPFHLPKNCP